MTVRSLLALPALALLAACASDPPPRPQPVAAAPPPPVVAPPPPAPTMAGMDGRYTGTARLAAGSPRSCRVRTMNVSANVAGDNVALMSGRNAMGTLDNARFDNGMIMGETARGECRYNVSLRKVGMRQPVRRGGRAM